MARDMGRGIIAPDNNDNIGTGASEMRTLGATTAAAISDVDVRVSDQLAEKLGKTEAYTQLVPRDEAEQYGIEGPRGPEGPVSDVPGPPGPGGSIALEETDPGCFVDSEITWMQWPQSGGLPAVWNPNTETYENPIRIDTSVGTRVFVGDTMIHGDTGWRAIQWWGTDGVVQGEMNLNGYKPREDSSGGVFYRRIGSQVWCRILAIETTRGDQVFPIPTFFGAGSSPWPAGLVRLTTSQTGSYQAGAASVFARFPDQTVTDVSYAVEFSWLTVSSWPTSLPGTPV